ncbi:MAG: serine/threonine protein kinase, partial [Chitinivibrionia bacterium]|nr:serine/threonine protein kinase [Chitinivibrionia bacterium]
MEKNTLDKVITPCASTTPMPSGWAQGVSRARARALKPGTVINNYQIISRIGRGGMGVVYLARQMNLERNVAFKVLDDHLAIDEQFIKKFFKEARSAASLNHPNIVHVHDAGTWESHLHYFVMEYIEGETLADRIIHGGPIDFKETIDIALLIGAGLKHAWTVQKITHGDIKPENIIITKLKEVKIADLGLAKSVYDKQADRQEIIITPLYAPPEIVSGAALVANPRTDMYSLGATLFHMLVGAPPFDSVDPELVIEKHIKEAPPLAHTLKPDLPVKLSLFVNKLLSKKIEDRPASWHEVTMTLEEIRRHPYEIAGHSANHRQDAPPFPPPKRTWWGLVYLRTLLDWMLSFLLKAALVVLVAVAMLYCGSWLAKKDLN